MSFAVELDPAVEARLAAEARRAGLPLGALARRVLENHVSQLPETPAADEVTLAMFREWEAEDATMTPEEIERENALWEQFQANVNETREALGMRRL